MIIDFHVHCFADEIAERAIASLSQAAGLPPRSDGTVAGIRGSMKKAGVDKSVLLSIATKPQQSLRITQWASAVQGEDLIAFGSIHPDSEDWEDELVQISSAGMKGIKFHPDYQQFFVDDPKMFPIYEKTVELGLIIIFHAGVDIGLPAPYHCTPDRLRRVIKAFPDAKIVAAHMGGFLYWDEAEDMLVGEQLYFDTAFSLHKLERRQFLRIASKHGYDRILFATDSPWGDQMEEVKRLQGMKLPQNAEEAILGGNAARLLGLTC